MKKFTLTELVLEIGCVCLIAALLVPAFGKFRAASEVNLCFDNMMRIGKGFMQYAKDHNGVLPPYNSNGLGITYFDAVYTYVQKEKLPGDRFFVKLDPKVTDDVWWCPAHLRVEPSQWIKTARLSMNSSYGYSRALTKTPVKLDSVAKPAEMLINTECGSYVKDTGELSGYYVADQWSVVARHGVEKPNRKEGSGNTIFADGSVREVSIQKTYGGKNWQGKFLPWDLDLDGK